ncbi:MAG: VCBS repeat-containing protein, partial [Acidimicrobiales bacterium]|nr:VCBS repeat-containing protein [Acidimicrobiales bacterium]
PPVVGVFKFVPSTNGATFVTSFLAFDQSFRGGVNIAAGDLDGDDKAEIVAGAGPGGAPHVRVLSGTGGRLPGSAYAYGANFPGGVYVAVGDVDGDGENDIVTGVGAGGGPHIRAFDIDMNPLSTSFYAYDAGFTGGVFVAVGKP